MDDLQNLQPGKIKRKNRRAQSESFMQLPSMTSSTSFEDPLLAPMPVASKQMPNESVSDSLLDDLLKSSLDPAEQALQSEEEPNAQSEASPSHASMMINEPTMPEKSATSDNGTASATHAEDANASDNGTANVDNSVPVSPLDLLNAIEPPKERDDVRKLTPGRRRSALANSQPAAEPTHAPIADAVETTIQRATRATEKSLDALDRLESAIDRTERHHFFNSAVAYILFCIILTTGLYFALNYKAKANYAYNSIGKERYEELLKAKEIIDVEYQKEQRAATEAFEVYQLIQSGRYEESLERYNKIQGDLTTHHAERALLEEKIDSIRWKLADNAYHDGIILFRDDNLEQARDAFYKSLSYKENTAYTDSLYYYLAMCLYQLGDYEGARAHFEKAMQGQLGPEMDANSRYYRGISAEKVGEEVEAYTMFDSFLRKYKTNKNADDALKRRAKHERAAKTVQQ